MCTGQASPFVGQASSGKGAAMPGDSALSTVAMGGQTQKHQQAVIDKFRRGDINVLVATCIGEEGLDIGAVDLVVFYDSVGSPIRCVVQLGKMHRCRILFDSRSIFDASRFSASHIGTETSCGSYLNLNVL
jgi:ERCC4-related helicase